MLLPMWRAHQSESLDVRGRRLQIQAREKRLWIWIEHSIYAAFQKLWFLQRGKDFRTEP
jgi:hypothetical protein